MNLRALFGPSVRDKIIDDLRAELKDERDRTRKLLRLLMKMKHGGASLPRALISGVLQPRELSENEQRLTAALDANPRTRKPGSLRNRNRTWAERELANDANAIGKIEARLRNWGVVDAEADDDDDDVIAVSS